jgi:hypothetical protein
VKLPVNIPRNEAPVKISPLNESSVHTRTPVALALLLSLSAAACATTRGLPASDEAKSVALPLQTCMPIAAPRVVGSRAFAPDGVEVQSRDAAFAIRFGQNRVGCVTVEASSATGPFAPPSKSAACPQRSGPIAATSDGETMLASEASDAQSPYILLGVVTYDVPLSPSAAHVEGSSRAVAWHAFQPPSLAGTGERSPKLVSLGDERFLLLWVEGDSERHQLRAQPLTGWGDAVGPAIDVSLPEMDVVGTPSAAIAPSGEGVVAFLASDDHGFDVMAAPIACGPRTTLQARASFARAEQVARR